MPGDIKILVALLVLNLTLATKPLRTTCPVGCYCRSDYIYCYAYSGLSCLSDLSDYNEIDIARANLSSLTENDLRKFKKLSSLTIRNSTIGSMGAYTFRNSGVRGLEISNCTINSIMPNAFRGSRLFGPVNLVNSRINKMTWKSFVSNNSFRVNMTGSPISCECQNYWLGMYDLTINTPEGFLSNRQLRMSDNLLFGLIPKTTTPDVRVPHYIYFDSHKFERCNFSSLCDPLPVPKLRILDMEHNDLDIVMEGTTITVVCETAAPAAKLYLKLKRADRDFFRPKIRLKVRKAGKFETRLKVSRGITNINTGDSMWVSCLAVSARAIQLDVRPLIVHGKPEVYFPRNFEEKPNSMLKRFEIWGLPFSNFSLLRALNSSYVPSRPTSNNYELGSFAVDRGTFEFKGDTAWRDQCLGGYRLKACNEYGCGHGDFFMQGLTDPECMIAFDDYRPRSDPWLKPEELASIVIPLVLSSICAVYLLHRYCRPWRQRKRQETELTDMVVRQAGSVAEIETETWEIQERKAKNAPDLVLNDCDYQTLRLIGEGEFGSVYLIEVMNAVRESDKLCCYPRQLALKITRPNLPCDLSKETKILEQLCHPNVVKFYGMVPIRSRQGMLFEYMECGDLAKFLRRRRPSVDGRTTLTGENLISIAVQIANGLQYLHDQNVVHRDLACRNCLVDTNLVVKVSDFGMARRLCTAEYYRVTSAALLPIRWSPPESIRYLEFTTQTDIWSFGVVLWEIFSFGELPWCQFTNEELLSRLSDGYVLAKPSNCTQQIYELMQSCWSLEPARRAALCDVREGLLGAQALTLQSNSEGKIVYSIIQKPVNSQQVFDRGCSSPVQL